MTVFTEVSAVVHSPVVRRTTGIVTTFVLGTAVGLLICLAAGSLLVPALYPGAHVVAEPGWLLVAAGLAVLQGLAAVVAVVAREAHRS